MWKGGQGPPVKPPALPSLHPVPGDTYLSRRCPRDSIGVIFRSFIISAGKSWDSFLQTKWNSINVPRAKDRDLNTGNHISKNPSTPWWLSSTFWSMLRRGETELFLQWSLEAQARAEMNWFYCVLKSPGRSWQALFSTLLPKADQR